MTDLAPESLLTVEDVARALNVGGTTVYDMVKAREIGHLRIGPTGRGVRFKPEHLVEYLARAEVPPVPPKFPPR